MSASSDDMAQEFHRSLQLIGRPAGHLQSLPLRTRWEASRRHPYYLTYWQLAKDYLTEPTDDKEANLVRFHAHIMLGMIGVIGIPVDPAVCFDQLDDEATDPGFLSGAVTPLTYRSLLINVISVFDLEELRIIGGLLLTAADGKYAVEGDSPERLLQRKRAEVRLGTLQHRALDAYFPGIVYVNAQVAQRTIVESLKLVLKRWKSRWPAKDERKHVKSYDEAFRVWDLREGWSDGEYDLSSEHSLVDVAKTLHLSKTTVINRYREAFNLIVGHEFSIDRWIALVSSYKLAGEKTELISAHTRRYDRLIQMTQRAPTTETTLQPSPEGHRSGVIERESAVDNHAIDDIDLSFNIKALLAKGMSDAEICHALELKHPEVVQYLREHIGEFGQTT